MTKFLVGCPVKERAWVLPTWFEHVERAAAKAELVPSYLFIIPQTDTPTLSALTEQQKLFAEQGKVRSIVFETTDEPLNGDVRDWSETRYQHMVELRNHLLRLVRELKPDFFLSLDSDILLHEDALATTLPEMGIYDAVGLKTFMTEIGTWAPSWCKILPGGTLLREDKEGFFRVDGIMAAKLMRPSAYNIDYVWHFQGEDIGYSLACKAAKLTLGWNGRVVNKHVMSPEALHRPDSRYDD